mmetsp:Transcript_31583/g.90601  ORF Transcript_31583/g.90601 Transcript_31583/m.90601 type:complete len:382 (+) Transcript_31583:443-1588(+)
MQQSEGVRLVRVQQRRHALQQPEDARGVAGHPAAAHAVGRRPLPGRGALHQLAGQRGVGDVARAVPDRPRASGEHRVPHVAPHEGPRTARRVQRRPLPAQRAPLKDYGSLSVCRATLAEPRLELVDATDGTVLRTGYDDLCRPGLRRLRRVVAEAEALADEHDVEQGAALTLRTGIELWRHVTGVVQGHKSVLKPSWQLPREALRLPPGQAHVAHIRTEEAHQSPLILPATCTCREGVCEHHARGNIPRLNVQLPVVGHPIGSRQQADTGSATSTSNDVKDVLRRACHHVCVRTKKLGAVSRTAPAREFPLTTPTDQSKRVWGRAQGRRPAQPGRLSRHLLQPRQRGPARAGSAPPLPGPLGAVPAVRLMNLKSLLGAAIV